MLTPCTGKVPTEFRSLHKARKFYFSNNNVFMNYSVNIDETKDMMCKQCSKYSWKYKRKFDF